MPGPRVLRPASDAIPVLAGTFLLLLAPGGLAAPPRGPAAPLRETDLSSLLEEESALTEEAETVVTATRYAQRVDRTPSNVHVITREQIDALEPKSLADVLRLVPGMAVLRRQQLGHELSAFGVGGQFSNKILVLLDGHRVTEPGFGATLWNELPVVLEEVERVEVVLGPESTLYGSNAFAGVVNIRTGRHRGKEVERLTLRGGNRGFQEQSYHRTTRLGDDGLQLSLLHELRGSFGPLADADHRVDRAFVSGESKDRLVARVVHEAQPDPRTRLRTSVAATQSGDSHLPLAPGAQTELDGQGSGVWTSLDLERSFDPDRTLGFRATYYRLERDLSASPFGPFGVPDARLDSSLGDFELSLRDRLGPWRMATGYYGRRVTTESYLVNGADPDATTSEVFLQGERDFGDRFVLFVGARWVFQDLADDELSWKVAGLYRPRRDLAFRLSLGTSFRQPDLITARFPTVATFRGAPVTPPIFVANPGLRNEVAHEFLQAGVERRLERGRWKLDYYTARLDDLISLVDVGPQVVAFTPGPTPLGISSQQWRNAANGARVRGVTLALERELGPLRLWLSANHQQVDGVPGSDDAPYAPPRSASLTLALPEDRPGGRRWSGSLSWTGVSATDVDRNAILDGAPRLLPGYGTVDLQWTRELSAQTSVTLAVKNLLDREHREMIYSLVGDSQEQGVWFGREVWLAVRVDL